MNKLLVCSAALAAALLISGYGQGRTAILDRSGQRSAKLRPGDKIRVNVFGEEKLSGEYEIDQRGQISLPLAGTIEAVV